jgi:hypothetical protein
MKGVLILLMYLREAAHKNKILKQQHKNKRSLQSMILMMEVIKTLPREIWSNLISFNVTKRKIQTNQQEVEELTPEDEVVLEDMDLDANIEDIEFPDEEKRLQESWEVAAELETQEPIFFEEESLTVHNALFDRSTKKLIFERIHSKNKKIQGKSNFRVRSQRGATF